MKTSYLLTLLTMFFLILICGVLRFALKDFSGKDLIAVLVIAFMSSVAGFLGGLIFSVIEIEKSHES